MVTCMASAAITTKDLGHKKARSKRAFLLVLTTLAAFSAQPIAQSHKP